MKRNCILAGTLGILIFYCFIAPIQVTIHYSQADVRLVSDEAALSLYQRTPEGWREAILTCPSGSAILRQEEQNILTATICQSGYFALFGPTNKTFLPVVFRLAF